MVRKSLAVVAIMMSVSCGTHSSSPTSPSASTATVSSIAVTAGAPAGAGFALTARALLSDNTTADVTASSAWESSNTALATVSGSGVVTVLAAGDVDFRATYQSVIGNLHLVVAQSRFTVSGRVSPAFPNQPLYLGGVLVQVMTGPNAGASAVSDASGAYRISGLSTGVIDLRGSIDGFSPWLLSKLSLVANVELDPVLYPTPPINTSGLRATAQCNDASWSWAVTPDRACLLHGGVAWGVCPGPICEQIGNIK